MCFSISLCFFLFLFLFGFTTIQKLLWMGISNTINDRIHTVGLRLHFCGSIDNTGNFYDYHAKVCILTRIEKRIACVVICPMSIHTKNWLELICSIRNWFVRWITGTSAQSTDNEFDYGSDDEDEEDKDREEKKTIKERLQTIQEVSQSVQNTIGRLASLGESVKKWGKLIFFFRFFTDWSTLWESQMCSHTFAFGFRFYLNVFILFRFGFIFFSQHIQLFRIRAELVGRYSVGFGLFCFTLHTDSYTVVALGLC